LIEGLAWKNLSDFLELLSLEIWKLSVGVFVNPSALHHVLGELNQSHDVSCSNLLWGSTHLVELSKHHDLREHNIEE
jgi:hypothetical protein